jgi:hypothetical protein
MFQTLYFIDGDKETVFHKKIVFYYWCFVKAEEKVKTLPMFSFYKTQCLDCIFQLCQKPTIEATPILEKSLNESNAQNINPLGWSHFLKSYANPWLKINSIGNRSMVKILKFQTLLMVKQTSTTPPFTVISFHQTINTKVFESIVNK